MEQKHARPFGGLRREKGQPSRLEGSPLQVFRVEGITRRGVIRFVKVVGRPGAWVISGLNGLNLHVSAPTVQDAVRMARRRIPFRPVAFRPLPGGEDHAAA